MSASTPTLAPEAVSGVEHALERLEQQTARLATTGDPLADVVAASAEATKAAVRLVTDASLRQQAHNEAMTQALQEVRKPWTREELRTMGTQMRNSLMHLWADFNRWGIAIGVAVAVVFGGVCGGSGYLIARSQTGSEVANLGRTLNGPDAARWSSLIRINNISAAWHDCQPVPQQSGGVACAFTLWTQLPSLK